MVVLWAGRAVVHAPAWIGRRHAEAADDPDRRRAQERRIDAVADERRAQRDVTGGVALCRRERREVAGQHLCRRDEREDISRPLADPGALIRAEEEQAIGTNRSAERA